MIRAYHSLAFTFLLVVVFACQPSGNSKEVNQDSSKESKESTSIDLNDREALDAAVLKNPNNVDALLARARFLAKDEKPQMAISDLDKAIGVDSANGELFQLKGELEFSLPYVGGALKSFNRAKSLLPDDARPYLWLGKVNTHIKKRQEAIDALNEALKREVFLAEAYYWKGLNYQEMQVPDKAISSYQTVLDIEPENTEVQIRLGDLYLDKDPLVSVKYYGAARRIDSLSFLGWAGEAYAYQRLDSLRLAVRSYQRTLQLKPDLFDAHFNLATCFVQQDLFDDALKHYKSALDIDPTSAKAYYGRGVCEKLQGRQSDAKKSFEQALRLDSNFKDAQDQLDAM